ncbi:MAG TPA: homoserine dehydrogenase [Gemmatimonadaceae bacterium]
MAPPIVRLGLIGCGTVGAAFARQLIASEHHLAQRLGARLHLAQVAVRHPRRADLPVPSSTVHSDAAALASDPDIDVVVEASGDPAASEWLRTAMERDAAVVTANKQAVARSPWLLRRLARSDRRLWCEGAVAAAIPVIRALRESLSGEVIHGIRGVINGTSTYVLSRLEQGVELAAALEEARARGYTELDAGADLDGTDAAAKLAILCTVAWRTPTHFSLVGVAGVHPVLPLVRQGGWRLVASATREGERIVAAVRAERLADGDPLAAASGVVNVVQVRAALAGTLTWSGAGAGGNATASALLGDVLPAARHALRRLRARVAA